MDGVFASGKGFPAGRPCVLALEGRVPAPTAGAAGQMGNREGCTRQPTFECAPLTRQATLCTGKRRGGRGSSALAGWTPPMDGVLYLGEGISCGRALYLGDGDGYRRQRSRRSGADGRQGGMCADAGIWVRPFDPSGDAQRRKTLRRQKSFCACRVDAPGGWSSLLREGPTHPLEALCALGRGRPGTGCCRPAGNGRGIRSNRQTNGPCGRDFPGRSFQSPAVQLTGGPTPIFVEVNGATPPLKPGAEERAPASNSAHPLRCSIRRGGKRLHCAEFADPIGELFE